MSTFHELIEKFCGDGVEWREIGEVCDIQTGKLNANAMNENGKYLFFTCNEFPSRIDTYAFDGKAIMISGNGSNVGHVNYYEGKFNAYQRTYVLLKFDECINVLFLFYYLKSNLRDYLKINSKKGSVPYITLPVIKNFKIPIPPIEVQKEIVRILDKFTNLIYELTRELTRELTLRKKQYEYYRDKLLTFGDGVPRVKLMELCIRQKGTNITAEFMKKCHRLDGKIKIFAGGNTTANVNYEDIPNLNVIDVPSVIVKSRGNIDFAYYDSLFSHKNEMWSYSSRDTSKINIKFIYYYLSNNVDYFKKKAVSGKLPQISTVVTDEFLIPLPPLEEQEKIANILDKFDKLCNDISQGIPAEIEMRQKQYEYYRDKLLTFEPKRY